MLMMSALTYSYEPSWRTRSFTRAVGTMGKKLDRVEKCSVIVCKQCMDSCKQQLKLFKAMIREIESYSREDFSVIEEDLDNLNAAISSAYWRVINRA